MHVTGPGKVIVWSDLYLVVDMRVKQDISMCTMQLLMLESLLGFHSL